MYEALGCKLDGNVAVKLHSGEDGNQNYLRPDFMKELVNKLSGTVVECNTAYDGLRTNNEDHKLLLHKHGWDEYYDVDIMDSEGDIALDIENGIIIKKNYVGAHITNYDSMLVLSHFKGHLMGGYGGALDQACIDLVKKSEDPGKEHFLERVNSRNGEHTIHCAEELGVGTREYELISID